MVHSVAYRAMHAVANEARERRKDKSKECQSIMLVSTPAYSERDCMIANLLESVSGIPDIFLRRLQSGYKNTSLQPLQ